jgi:hypothetical protein
MAKEVTVKLDNTTGAFSVDRTGFKGKGCDAVLKVFEGLGDVTSDKKKPEYRQETVNLIHK